jgi:peroxiredoxin (alkyl hydroperoxide reductase subunit C)
LPRSPKRGSSPGTGALVAYRATYLIDPEGTIQHVSINGLNVGRNVKEIIRVLDALQTGELTPCEWVPGEATLS